jgi:inner membrane protein
MGSCFNRPEIHNIVWPAGTTCSVVPDLDVIGFRLGIVYGDFWGNRGFTHSLVFAAVLAGGFTLISLWWEVHDIGRFALFGYLFLAGASHGVLDAMTNGGLGLAFFSPFDNTRYFLP